MCSHSFPLLRPTVDRKTESTVTQPLVSSYVPVSSSSTKVFFLRNHHLFDWNSMDTLCAPLSVVRLESMYRTQTLSCPQNPTLLDGCRYPRSSTFRKGRNSRHSNPEWSRHFCGSRRGVSLTKCTPLNRTLVPR